MEKFFALQLKLKRQFISQSFLPVIQFVFAIFIISGLIWVLGMTIRGKDGLQMVRDFVDSGEPLPIPPARGGWHEPFVDRWKLKLELFDVYGALPAAGDRGRAVGAGRT